MDAILLTFYVLIRKVHECLIMIHHDQVLGQRTRLAFLDTRAASEALPRIVEVGESCSITWFMR